MGHLVEDGRIVFHTVLEFLLRSTGNGKFLLWRNCDIIEHGTVVGSTLRVTPDGTYPFVTVEHTVEGLIDIHTLGILSLDRLLRLFEAVEDFPVIVRTDFGKGGLVDVENGLYPVTVGFLVFLLFLIGKKIIILRVDNVPGFLVLVLGVILEDGR